jgi:hypothetical protein
MNMQISRYVTAHLQFCWAHGKGSMLLISLPVIFRPCGAALKTPGKCHPGFRGGTNLQLEGSQRLAGVQCRISLANSDHLIYVVMRQK